MNDKQESVGDVTLIRLLNSCGNNKQISEDAATQFYARYMEKLMSLVERNLASRFSARVSPEDIVQSVFGTWFRRAKEGQFKLSSPDEVWVLLAVVALCKVRNKVRFHDAERRAVSKTVSGEEIFGAIPEPTPDDAVVFIDLIETASKRLDEKPRRTLELTLEGRSIEEIATELGRTTRSVSRYKSKDITRVLRELLDEDLKYPEDDPETDNTDDD